MNFNMHATVDGYLIAQIICRNSKLQRFFRIHFERRYIFVQYRSRNLVRKLNGISGNLQNISISLLGGISD